MGIKYLWDTNTAIYYLQQQFPPAAEKFMDDSLKELNLVFRPLPRMEYCQASYLNIKKRLVLICLNLEG